MVPSPSSGSSSGSSAKRKAAARERSAAMRAAAARSERRRRLLLIAGSALGVLVVIGVIVAVGLSGGKQSPKSGASATDAPAAVVTAVAGVPQSTLESVGKGDAKLLPQPIKADPLTENGKPQVLYVGAEYCPYCAAERWAMVQALSRFGTFTGLGATHSATADVYPDTATFSFHGASYTSDYLAFTGKELRTNEVVGGNYAPLDTLTADEDALFSKYSANRAFPFVDLGGQYVVNGAQFDPAVLQGKTLQQIADALADPNSKIAKAVDGTANTLTAALCKLTGGQPAQVCSSPAVSGLQSRLGG